MTLSPSVRKGIWIAPLLLATLGIGVAVVVGIADASPTEQTEPAPSGSPLLTEVGEQIALPARTWTASGTHTAQGYTTEAASTISVAGMKADCDNINLNKKLAADFRSDVFGPGMKGFFYKCQRVGSGTNKYWFTISSAKRAQIDKLCDPRTTYPLVHDEQHRTYWIDKPFTCTSRVGPS
ncbi:hypothetical protein [Streptomyces angustmyceticus]|uniref:hypothetical protein n=1 Tax=Streptomyces angustmyceticus TaxID=285578 RepID=UPI0021AECD92|nr:hypothetical protein [Streptomyces angustmyceticus]